jgi:hypothetical protein
MYFHVYGSDCRLGFGLVTAYNKQLYIQLVIVFTSNYTAIANLHILQITGAHAKPFQSAFTGRFTVTDLKNGDSSATVLKLLLSDKHSKI